MRPSSSPSKRTVLSQNSTRPSHRRRRRLRFELQLERLEERSLLSTGLVAAYNFDAGSGAVLADVSGNGNNGTITGAAWTTSGKYGGALVFNGTNALVTVNDSASLHLTTAMTLEAWVDPSAVSSAWRDVIYKGNDNYWLEATSENSGGMPAAGATLGSSDVDTLGTAALTANTWAFLTETYNGSTLAHVRERDAGLEPGAYGEHRDLDRPVANRRRQHLRTVLPGNDRQRADLQHGVDPGSDSDGHEHADREQHDTTHGDQHEPSVRCDQYH